MDKPISLRIDDTINEVARVINESDIPIWMLEHDFMKLAEEISRVARMQKEQDRKAYEESLAKLEKEDETSEEAIIEE